MWKLNVKRRNNFTQDQGTVLSTEGSVLKMKSAFSLKNLASFTGKQCLALSSHSHQQCHSNLFVIFTDLRRNCGRVFSTSSSSSALLLSTSSSTVYQVPYKYISSSTQCLLAPKVNPASQKLPLFHSRGISSGKHFTPIQPGLAQVATPELEESFLAEVPEKHDFKGADTEFPCLIKAKDTGPEPQYDKITKGYQIFRTEEPFPLVLNGGKLPQLEMAYETWGELNEDGSNAVIILAGLSASSHAKSSIHNPSPGWWEKFVGPGCAVDTNKFFVVCPNNLGGCYGSSGPSSINILTGKPYATTFPIVTLKDMVNAIFLLLEDLGVKRLYGSVGSSLGGMLSLQAALSFPEKLGRIISISACAQSHPTSIAMRYLQRKCIMCDPHWNNGHYYDGPYPKTGMKLAREIATMTYRSGPEWDKRFGRNRISDEGPSLCPTFLVESYLEHQGESFSTKYDPNSLLYISKAMDLFDVAEDHSSIQEALTGITCPVMVIGVQTDILFPIWQQRELANALQAAGNKQVTFYELNSIYGHDTFLLDLNGVGAAVKGFLETEQRETGWLTKHEQVQPHSKPT